MTARVSIKRAPRGYVGTITIRSDAPPGMRASGVGDIGEDIVIQVGAVGESGADALLKAGSVIDRVMSDPIMRAIMPPQAKVAIETTKKLATAAKHGGKALKSLWGRIRGSKGKKKLAKALQRSTPRTGVRDNRPTKARFTPNDAGPPPEQIDEEEPEEALPDETQPAAPEDEASTEGDNYVEDGDYDDAADSVDDYDDEDEDDDEDEGV